MDSEETLEEQKNKFPSFYFGSSVKNALDTIFHYRTFPEDYVESRTGYKDLTDQFDKVCDGFEQLIELLKGVRNEDYTKPS